MYSPRILLAIKELVEGLETPQNAEVIVALARERFKEQGFDVAGRTIVRALSYLTNNLHWIRAVIIGPRGRLGYVGLKWRKTLDKAKLVL